MEGQGVLGALHIDAQGVIVARHMQRPDMQADNAGDDEGQQIVQREEAVQGGFAHREVAPQPGGDGLANHWHGTEHVGDDRGAPEGHLAPGQHVAEEGGGGHQQIDQHADDPDQLARRLVGAVIEAAEHVDIDGQEEHGRAVGVNIADQPAVIDVAHDGFNRVEGQVSTGNVMHCQHDAGDDLDRQAESEDAAEDVPDVQVTRRREGAYRVVHQTRQRQTRIDPLLEAGFGIVGRRARHFYSPQPTLIRVSDMNV